MVHGHDIGPELWLADRLGIRYEVTLGITDSDIRASRIQAAIADQGCAQKFVGYHGDVHETFAECFERIYGKPLFTTNEEK